MSKSVKRAGDTNPPSATLAPHLVSADEAADRAALQHLAHTYGHAVDRRDYNLLTQLYHPDATDDHRPYFQGFARDYIDWLPQMMANWSATAHTMLSTVFLIDGVHAEGLVSARAWHRTLDGQSDFIAWGRYADRYEKRDGIWRFAHRMFVLDSTEERKVDNADAFGTNGVAISCAGADDPAYQALPRMAADRAR